MTTAPFRAAEAAAALEGYFARFLTPPPEVRPQPLWVWNGAVTESWIETSLTQLAEAGCGGVFIHPRPGMLTEYLSEEWFRLWTKALETCSRLGLFCHLYDENTFPSGLAGGHVVAENPALALPGVHIGPAEAQQTGELMAELFFDPSTREWSNGGADSPAKASARRISVRRLPPKPRAFFARLPAADICRPESTAAFLRLTHEAYRTRIGEHFGKTVRLAFSDEPQPNPETPLLLSSHFEAAFEAEHGYALRPRLRELVGEAPESPAVRFDYCRTLQRLFEANFCRPMSERCAEMKLAWTGHFMEHRWPSPYACPSTMAALRWMHLPGIDLLGLQFSPTCLADNTLWLLNLKEAASVARQFGREGVLCESSGAGSYEMGPREFRRLESFAIAFGVTLLNPHMVLQTLAGSRKHDFPQCIGPQSSWFVGYRRHADAMARLLAVLTQGLEETRIAVLHPTTTGWCFARPGEARQAEEGPDPLPLLRRQVGEFYAALHAAGQLFDLVDELLLAEHGAAENGRLRCGQVGYDLVIFPPGLRNIERGALDILEAFLERGGHVLAAAVPDLVNGRPDRSPADLAGRFGRQWRTVSDPAELIFAVGAHIAPAFRLRDGQPPGPGLVWRRVRLDQNWSALFLTNPWAADWSGELRLPEGSVALHADEGRVEDGPSARLRLRSGEFRLFLLPEHEVPAQPVSPIGVWQRTHARLVAVTRAEPNALLLDYADLQLGATPPDPVLCDRPVPQLDDHLWRWHGFAGNPWSFAVQFRRNTLEAEPARRDGHRITYRFMVDPSLDRATLNGLSLLVEVAGVDKVCCNGWPLVLEGAKPWRDESFRVLALGEAVRAGENEIVLYSARYHPCRELAPVYVLGDFALAPGPRGFVVRSARALELGNWAEQGLPFYADSLRYAFSLRLDQAARATRIEAGEWQGSLLRAHLDGVWIGDSFDDVAEFTCADLGVGEHRLDIELFGNMRNLLGPHHAHNGRMVGKPGTWCIAHPSSWRAAAPRHQPPGADYCIRPVSWSGALKIDIRSR